MNNFDPTKGRFKRSLLAGVSAFSLGLTGAHAQDTSEDQEDDNFDEIIVTGTKRAMSIQDVGQSISAFSTEAIERQGLQQMDDYVKSLPSMTLFATQPGRNQVIFRGFSSGSFEYRTESSAAVYFDEQPMTAVSQQVDPRMVDIERIESLPGPQGTLFGSSSQTGTLRVITNKPDTSDFSGMVDAALSTVKGGEMSYDLSGVLNIPIVEDKLAIRAVGFKAKDGGYIDNVLTEVWDGQYDNAPYVEDNFNDMEYEGGRLHVLWEASDDWQVLATAMMEESTATGSWDTDKSLGDYKVARFNDEYRIDKWWSTALTITGDLGFATLTAATTYIDRDVIYEWDGTAYSQWRGSAFANVYYEGTPYEYTVNFNLYNTGGKNDYLLNDQYFKRFTQEVRLTSQGDSRFQWMVGAFYERVEDHWDWTVNSDDYMNSESYAYANYWSCYYAYYDPNAQCPLQTGDVWYLQLYDRVVKQKAVFGEVGYDLTDRLNVTIGGRWFEYDRDRLELNQWPLGFPPVDAELANFFGGTDRTTGKQSDTVWKFNIKYELSDDTMLYAIYSEGFRLGGTNSARAANSGFVPREYDPDSMTNWEMGFKSTLMDGQMTLNGTFFQMRWKDLQRTIWDPDVWWRNGTINSGRSKSTGAEIQLWYNVTDNFKLEGSAFIADAEYVDPVMENDEIFAPAGTRMTWSPKLKYWLAAEYTIPSVVGDADLWFRYDFSYTGTQLQNLASNRWVGKQYYNNFQVGLWAEGEWDATLSVNNIFNGNQVTSISDGDRYVANFFGSDLGHTILYRERPREITLRYRKRF